MIEGRADFAERGFNDLRRRAAGLASETRMSRGTELCGAFVRFKDAGGVTRGSTSVAVRTQ